MQLQKIYIIAKFKTPQNYVYHIAEQSAKCWSLGKLLAERYNCGLSERYKAKKKKTIATFFVTVIYDYWEVIFVQNGF